MLENDFRWSHAHSYWQVHVHTQYECTLMRLLRRTTKCQKKKRRLPMACVLEVEVPNLPHKLYDAHAACVYVCVHHMCQALVARSRHAVGHRGVQGRMPISLQGIEGNRDKVIYVIRVSRMLPAPVSLSCAHEHRLQSRIVEINKFVASKRPSIEIGQCVYCTQSKGKRGLSYE